MRIHTSTPLLAAALLLGGTATAQSVVRVGLFGPGTPTTFAFPPGAVPAVEYSMCTGLTDPLTGREFAVAAAQNGILIVDAVQPTDSNDDLAGVQLDSWFFQDTPDSRWRCVGTFRNYIYAGSFMHPGLRRFRVDTTQPRGQWITDLGYAPSTVAATAFSGPRSTIDQDHGLYYTLGADPVTGLPKLCVFDIYDEVADDVLDPPQLLAEWIPGGLMFDVMLHGDRAYVSYHSLTSNAMWRVLDVSSLWTNPPATPGAWNPTFAEWDDSFSYNALSHDNYVSPDGQTWFVSYEGGSNGGQVMGRDLGSVSFTLNNGTMPEPPPVSIYNLNVPGQPQESMHSMRGIGLTGYVSHWTAGLHVIDLSTPLGATTNLPLVASYDTSSMPSGTQVGDGVWDCYPHTDSGLVYVNDSEEGLSLLRIDVGHVNRYGPSKSNGTSTPRIEVNNGPPRVSKVAEIEVKRMLPNGIGVLALSDAEDQLYLLTGSPLQLLGAPVLVNVSTAATAVVLADPAGVATLPVSVPNQPQLIGWKLFTQAFELVNGSTLASSRGTWFGLAQ